LSVKINPKELRGVWRDGYALDIHTTGSTFLGYDAYGHERYDTTRSGLGDLLYRLKYGRDRAALQPIIEAVVAFWGTWKPAIDAIVPVPPSNTARKSQPVLEVATALSEQLGIQLCTSCISKVRSTGQLKDVFDFQKREALLKDAFAVDRKLTEGKRLLLFDDLYRSGATVTTITRMLAGEGRAKAVYLLTLTRTRSTS
jgi:predicted amidophosphoribosyltransferase